MVPGRVDALGYECYSAPECFQSCRSFIKRSMSDGNILCQDSSHISICNDREQAPINLALHATTAKKGDALGLSDSTTEISTCESGISYPRFNPGIDRTYLITYGSLNYFNELKLDVSNCSNFLDCDWISSGNSCYEENYESWMTGFSAKSATGGSCPTKLTRNQKPLHLPITQNSLMSKEDEIVREMNKSIHEWSEHQLLAYLLGSQAESEVMNSPESCSHGNLGSFNYDADSMQPLKMVESVLDSIKRTLSFGALDELMLHPPSKRLLYANICEQQSAASSFSVDQFCPEFII